MSNIAAARANIKAEIAASHTQIAALHAQIQALEKSLVALDKLDDLTGTAASATKKPGKRGRKPKAQAAAPVMQGKPATIKAAVRGKAAQKPVKKSKEKIEGELPFTGSDYWPNLVTSEPQSASDILQKAIDGLGFTPTTAQITKLTNRATFALNSLVKEGRIQDSGKGRERRFFIA